MGIVISVTIPSPIFIDTVGEKEGTGQITTTSTPNPGDVQSQARPQGFADDSTITDHSKSTVVTKFGPGSKVINTEGQTASKDIVYLDDLRDNLTVAFTEGLGKLKDNIERQSQHAHEIKSQLVNMQKDVTKLIPQTKELSLLRNSVEASDADLNTVGSVVVAIKTGETMLLGFREVASETGATIAEVAQDHLQELAYVCGDVNGFLEKVVDKLSVYMSDRASNEKKSNRLLDEWRLE